MKYRFARGPDGGKVDILELSKADRRGNDPFLCFGCGRQLIPVLGVHREKHFRHRAEEERECSRESYLHVLAKKQIVEGFLSARQAQKPYTLRLPAERHCTRWKDELGHVCNRSIGWRDFDLTHHFDGIEEEAPVDGFVADVLLTSSKNDEKLLIEIAVTHRCEAEKIGSGLRIVEVSVTAEDQLDLLVVGIDAQANNVCTFNLKRQLPLIVLVRPTATPA